MFEDIGKRASVIVHHSSNPSCSIDEEYEMVNYPHLCKYHTTFHITCNKDFKQAYGKTSSFLSMEKLWVGVKKFIHDMFELAISIIEASCLGMNTVFNKMESLHQIL